MIIMAFKGHYTLTRESVYLNPLALRTRLTVSSETSVGTPAKTLRRFVVKYP